MSVQNLAILTICSNNYVPMARVLIESARQHHPNAAFYLCLADELLPDPGFYPPDCKVVVAADLEIPEFSRFAFRYDIMEFNTALKPYVLLSLLERGHDAVLYFDPDIEVFAPLDGIMHPLDDGISLVLTPHLLQPAEGESDPDDVGIMRVGIYNLGFVGVGATAEARAVLEWLTRRLRYQCISDPSAGLFVDQKFFDLAPGFIDRIQILRDPRYNVAYWNLAQRRLTQNGEGWRVDGQDLGFFHFSGFECGNYDRLSKYSTAFRQDDIPPPLLAILQHYSDRVVAQGYREARNIPYAYGHFASGIPIPSQVRRLFCARHTLWPGNPFMDFEDHVRRIDPACLPAMSTEELTDRLQAVYASSSWRLTRPLRAFKQLIGRLSQRGANGPNGL